MRSPRLNPKPVHLGFLVAKVTLRQVFHQRTSVRPVSTIPRLPYTKLKKTKLRGLSPRANYTDRAAAAGRRSYCQLLRVEGCHVVSATGPHGR
jgi:hypothetical protein